VLGEVRNRQGRLAGKSGLLGLDLKKETLLHAISDDIVKSAGLEGITLDDKLVQSSVAGYLNFRNHHLPAKDPLIENIVNVTIDALSNYRQPVTESRIFHWKKACNILHNSDMSYEVNYCNSFTGSRNGALYAFDSMALGDEVNRLIKWLNTAHPIDPVLKAGVAHIRFLFIHPFDEDNGLIARSLMNIFLTRADDQPKRLFCLSAQMYKQQDAYRQAIQQAHLTKNLDITEWLMWYLYCLETALIEAEKSLTRILEKSKFWEKYRLMRLNERQVKMINLLWEGLEGNLTSSYWANMNLCSPDTALRDIQDLIDKKILYKKDAGGRSTSYELN
jgi:Fic family protein